MNLTSNKLRAVAALLAAIAITTALVSCGGGGGASSGGAAPASIPLGIANDPGSPNMPVTPTPAPTAQSKDGDWNNAATWSTGKLPADGDVIEIPVGKTVTLRGATSKLAGLTVNGTLVFADTDISLTTNWMMVHGSLIAGSEVSPYARKATITLTGKDKSQNIMNMGTKLIGVMGGGTVELHGEKRMSWTQLSATANISATSITVKDEAGSWRVGDKLVIAPSGFEADEYEVVTVNAVSGKQISFSPALKYTHWGTLQTFEGKTLDQRAAVGLLTRNIVIRGDGDSDDINFGGHMMVMAGAKTKISGVEFDKMGQRGIKGRYPFHWHLAGDLTSGDYVKNNSIHDSFQRAIVVHGTNNALVEGNVAFNITNHAFVWAEDGNEVRNSFIKNLAVFNKNPKDAEFAFPISNPLFGNTSQSEFRSASFWGRGFNHTITGNIAAGSVDGFGFFFDRFSPSALGETEGKGLVFEDNIAHSNYRPGAAGVASEIYPEATFGHGLMVTSNLKEITSHLFKRFTSYKNYGGAWLEERSTQLQDSIVADNGTGIYILRGVVNGVVVVSKTANTIGNSEIPPKGGFGSSAKGAIVVPSSHGGARAPVILDATVVNHDDAAYVVDVDDLGYTARVEKLKLVNTKRAAFFHEFNPYEYVFAEHGIDDSFGALNGGQPTVWVKRRSALVNAACTSNVSQNSYACPLNNNLLLRYRNAPNRTTYLVQPNGAMLGIFRPFYFDANMGDAQDINSGWVGSGSQYEVLIAADDTKAADIELYLEQSAGKTLELSWAVSGAATKVSQNGINLTVANSLVNLRGATTSAQFYDVGTQKLYVKLVGAVAIQTIKISAPFASTNIALLGRSPEAVQGLVAGALQSNQPSSPSSQLRQVLPNATSGAALNLSAFNFSTTQGLLSSASNAGSVFKGFVNAPADGVYTLSVPGVGGNVDVWVGNTWVSGTLNNRWTVLSEPSSSLRDEAGLIALRKGVHPVTVVFGRNELQADYNSFAPRFSLRWALPGSDQHVAIPVLRAP